jgi:hypothetical protein
MEDAAVGVTTHEREWPLAPAQRTTEAEIWRGAPARAHDPVLLAGPVTLTRELSDAEFQALFYQQAGKFPR